MLAVNEDIRFYKITLMAKRRRLVEVQVILTIPTFKCYTLDLGWCSLFY